MAPSKTRTPRLGRGLSSLLNTGPVPVQPPPGKGEGGEAQRLVDRKTPAPQNETHHAESATAGTSTRRSASGGGGGQALAYVAVDRIAPNPNQPRQKFEPQSLARLAESIKADGLMQPIILTPAAGDRYELVAGERRWRAARLAGLDQVPALVRILDQQQRTEWALIENLQREDLNPIERAEAFAKLIQQHGLNHDQIAKRVGIERPTVSNLLRLLNLCTEVQDLVREGLVSAGHARAIAAISDAQGQAALARRVVQRDLSVRQTEQEARTLAAGADDGKSAPAARTSPRSAHLADLAQQIGRQLGSRVRLRQGRRKGAGSITIDFYTNEQFDALLEKLGVKVE